MSDFLLGTPYFVTRCNQKLYVPEIDQYSRIVEYNMVDGKVNFDDSTVLFDFGKPDEASIRRKLEFPV